MTTALSESSLRDWMQRLGPGLLNLSVGICRDRHQAEEVVQEAFVRLWRRPPDAGEVAYASWLRRVVTNLSINCLKRTRRPGALPELSLDPALRDARRPEAPIQESEGLDRVRTALGMLDPSKRAILVLRGQEGLSYDAIATHLGVPIGTVMSRLNRARTALLAALEELDATGTEEPTSFDIQRYRKA